MNAMIEVGASKEAVETVGNIILRIIEAACQEATKVAALETLRESCNVNNMTIHNCTFWGDGKTEQEGEQEDAG